MKILIVGGVAGGMSCAARARRLDEKAHIVVFEKSGYVSFANCGLPYHIGGVIKDRNALLLQTKESLAGMLNIDVRLKNEVMRIDRKKKSVSVKDLSNGREYEESYDKLVLAPGASPIRPQIQGIDLKNVFMLRNIEDMDAIKRVVDSGQVKDAVVVGGGYIGVEMAENFVKRGIRTHLVELLDQVMPPFDREMARDIENQLAFNGISLHLGTAAAAFRSADGKIHVELQNSEVLPADIVILSVGVRPDSMLASEAGLEVNQRGGIIVNPNMQTSDPDIYAVGDAVETLDLAAGIKTQIPLAGPANRQGRIAADNICGLKSVYKGTYGAAVIKAFKLSAACVGASEKTLKKLGREYGKAYLHPSNHAGYYPGATPIHLKLLFSKPDGKILGAQAVGFEGVDKRIDVLATAIKAGMTVFDLEELELCYAPPFGSAKDPINMAGFTAANMLRGDLEYWYAEDFPEKTKNGLIIDVRPSDMFNLWHIPGAINIPLPLLRSKLSELSQDRDIFLYCKVGFTSYLAYRILKQNGFGVNGKALKTLSGGIMTFCCFHGPGVCASDRMNPFVPYLPEKEKSEKAAPVPAQSEKTVMETLDLRGLQCPGPIMKIREAVSKINEGDSIAVVASDPGFARDIGAWCSCNSCELLEIKGAPPEIHALIRKKNASATCAPCGGTLTEGAKNALTIVVFSGELDKALAAFVIANGAIAGGKKVTMFFTFWGLNILRKGGPQKSGKSLMDAIFGAMMPNGADNLKLSKMNMCGMGTMMMKEVMKNKKVESLPSLMKSAIAGGAEIVACSMSMDVMGLHIDELIDGVKIGGVATFLAESDKSSATLFI